ncbi:hypothetical protein [Streptomyces sp. NPDC089799]|uniref:hypothetical protein n=1 Tax=Streptomyces sp. NPDC089799 TaxID=3155066 RepID=UPI00342A7DE7
MPIDPFAALNAMLRAEAARFSPPPPPPAPASPAASSPQRRTAEPDRQRTPEQTDEQPESGTAPVPYEAH